MRFIIFLWFVLFPLMGLCSEQKLRVEITGVTKEEKKILFPNLSIKQAEKEIGLNEDRIVGLHQLASEEIITTLQALGYYHSTITAKLFLTHHLNHTEWTAEYHILPGPPVRVRSITFRLLGPGQNNRELYNIIKNATLKKGMPLNHNDYGSFKQLWLGKALQLGYLDAIFNVSEIQLDRQQNQADIVLEMDTGVRYHFGEIHFASPPYPIPHLKRCIPFKPGTPYTTENLLLFQKSLTETDLFSKVRIDPNLNEATDYLIPVKVRLIPRPANKYTASLGFGSDTGPRGTVGYEHRLQSLPGHRFNINVKGSERLNQGNIQYSIPGKNPVVDRLVFGYQVTEEKPVDKTYSLSKEVGITHIQKREPVEQILAIQYLKEKFKELPEDPKQKTHFLLPSIGLVWSDIDRKALLPEGTHVTLIVRGGLGLLLSTTNLIQAENRVKWAIRLGDETRLILRTDMGATAISNKTDFPLTLRFFAGGDHSVRGYGYQSLAPTETDAAKNEIRIGGRYLFVGSSEIERRVYKNLSAAIFFDAGNAFNHWGASLARSAGCGIRWRTPLGPIRLDIAQAIPRAKRKPRIHLSFGMDL